MIGCDGTVILMSLMELDGSVMVVCMFLNRLSSLIILKIAVVIITVMVVVEWVLVVAVEVAEVENEEPVNK